MIALFDPCKAFALTLTDELGAGIAILTAMIIKLIPQKLGDAVILSKAGLNHFWENLLSLGAVSFVYVGKFSNHPSLLMKSYDRGYSWNAAQTSVGALGRIFLWSPGWNFLVHFPLLLVSSFARYY